MKPPKEIKIDEITKHLGLQDKTLKIFELLLVSKPAPVSLIAKQLHFPKSTVYDAISNLMEKSLVVEYSENNTKIYGIAPKDQIIKLHLEKIEEIKISQEFITQKLQEIQSRKTITQPKIKLYSGTDGIRHAFNDMPWVAGCKESYLMWPMQDMIDTVGEEFLMQHGRNRYKHAIKIKVIRKESDRKIDSEWLNKDRIEKLTEARYAQKDINWSMSYWIYDDKCLFATGGEEKFAFIIYSKEFANLIKTMWEQIWKISKK